jgi:hypothetical protein
MTFTPVILNMSITETDKKAVSTALHDRLLFTLPTYTHPEYKGKGDSAWFFA